MTMIVERLAPSQAALLDPLTVASSREHPNLASELGKPHSLAWVARPAPDAPPVAFLLVWAVADELEIVDLATSTEARRRGAARALLHALLEYGRTAGCASIWLEVKTTNAPALRLYESVGFEGTRTRANYYPDGADALEQVLWL